MSGSVNKVMLIGNLGKDPEQRLTQDGMKIVSFTMATSESWKDKMSGERKEKVEWHRIVVLNQNLCDIAHKYLKKGSKICLEGKIQSRTWQDNNNIERQITEIVLSQYHGELVLLDTRQSQDNHFGSAELPNSNTSISNSSSSTQKPAENNWYNQDQRSLSDEIPF